MPDQLPPEINAGDSLQVDFKDIVDDTSQIYTKVISDLTQDLAAQRSISKALQRQLAGAQQELEAYREQIMLMEAEMERRAKEADPDQITDIEQAERVLDRIIADPPASSNDDKPPTKEVGSPRRPASPPVKEPAKT